MLFLIPKGVEWGKTQMGYFGNDSRHFVEIFVLVHPGPNHTLCHLVWSFGRPKSLYSGLWEKSFRVSLELVHGLISGCRVGVDDLGVVECGLGVDVGSRWRAGWNGKIRNSLGDILTKEDTPG